MDKYALCYLYDYDIHWILAFIKVYSRWAFKHIDTSVSLNEMLDFIEVSNIEVVKFYFR